MSSATTTPSTSARSRTATDRPRFREAARPHLGWLYWLARGLVGDPDAAEDLVQRCLLEAHRAYGDLRDVETLPAWLKQILVDCGRGHWQAQERGAEGRSLDGLEGHPLHRTSTVEDPLPRSDGLHVDVLSAFEIDDVWAVLERLETIYRVPLVLVHIEGYTTAEVAGMLDAPQETVLSRLHGGRKRFERQLWHHAQARGLLVAEPGCDRVHRSRYRDVTEGSSGAMPGRS